MAKKEEKKTDIWDGMAGFFKKKLVTHTHDESNSLLHLPKNEGQGPLADLFSKKGVLSNKSKTRDAPKILVQQNNAH